MNDRLPIHIIPGGHMDKNRPTETLERLAARRYKSLLDDARGFVTRTLPLLEQAGREGGVPLSVIDTALARKLSSMSERNVEIVAQCMEEVKTKAWLPDAPTLGDVLVKHGHITQQMLDKWQLPHDVKTPAAGKARQ